MNRVCMLLSALLLLVASCDQLDDSGNVASDILPGTWLFSYQLQSNTDTGLEFQYEQVIFRDDGTCSITYPDGAIDGTYKASGTVIRIEGNVGGQQRTMLWRILTLARKKVTVEYVFEWGGESVTAIVTLDRDTDS